jgi:hypothetical protein
MATFTDLFDVFDEHGDETEIPDISLKQVYDSSCKKNSLTSNYKS